MFNPSPGQPFKLTSLTLAVLVMASAGCSGCPHAGAPVPDTPDGSRASARQVVLACYAIVDDSQHLWVNGRDTGLVIGDPEDDVLSGISAFPLDDHHILVAERPVWARQFGASPGGILWRADCRPPGQVTELVSMPGADFGNAAMTRDGRHLFYTGPDGIGRLDIGSLESRPITQAPVYSEYDCWAEDARGVDVVAQLLDDDRTLAFYRGGPCGYEADWVAVEMRLSLDPVSEGSPPNEPAPITPVGAIAADAGGVLWMGDGGRCDQPGVVDPQTPGTVWRSRDYGDTFEPLRVTADVLGEMPTAVRHVFTDAERPGHVLVLSSLCTSSAARIGGALYRTLDSGRTWQAIPLDAAIVEAFSADLGQGITAVLPVGGDLEHLRIWRIAAFGSEDLAVWETSDGGLTWAAAQPTPLPEDQDRSVTIGGYRFDATTDGLLRTPMNGGQVIRVFPQEPHR